MRLIKRYSNRKLYDTTTRTYITLDGLATLVADGAEIKVLDNDTDEDLTTIILSQLLLERERSHRSLPSSVLSGLLRSGLSRLTNPMSGGLVNFLEHEIERNLKFWVEVGQGGEEEVLRTIEGLIEKRRRARINPEAPKLGLGLLRRDLDDFEDWAVPETDLGQLAEELSQIAQTLAEKTPQAHVQAEIAEIARRIRHLRTLLD